MSNPTLVEVLRGGLVESSHAGAVAVFDDSGKPVLALGDIDRPVFPRSAVKAIQALPLVESGAADAFGFGQKELALACASHTGEAAHIELAAAMLGKASFGQGALECGVHWPTSQQAMIALARSGERPSALHNNCSGKHAGFLCGCRHLGIAHAGYVRPDHPWQEAIRRTMSEVTGAPHDERNRGIDGCSIPTYAVPLKDLAFGFARMATGRGLSNDRAFAARRLFEACLAEPCYVAGTDRFDTRLMIAAGGRIFVKSGAEGVHCGAIPELGLGIAIKCDDGQGRAAEVAIAAVLAKLFGQDQAMPQTLAGFITPALANWNGIEVGALRPAEALR